VLSLTREKLKNIFHKEKAHIPSRYTNTIRDAFSKYLAPPDNIVKKELELLNKDVYLHRIIDDEITKVEDEMIKLVRLTEGKQLLNTIKGITEIEIASYIGIIGSVKKYANAKKIFALSGLAPTIKESGGRIIKGLGIKRKGNKYLGALLFKMAMSVILTEPYFYKHFHHLRHDMKKPYKKAIIGVAKKLNNVMFAMIRKKEPFVPPPFEAVSKEIAAG